MKNIKDKLIYLWIPFLLIALSFIIIYSLLTWVLFMPNFSFLKEGIIKIWLPFTLPWIPVLIWLRPRIKTLRFYLDYSSFGYQFVAVLAIAIPTIIAQEYLATATGKLTELETVNQFEQKKTTKYYSIKKSYIDTTLTGAALSQRISGRHHETLNLDLYVTLPVFINAADTANAGCNYFIGKIFSKSISNRLSEQEKREQYSLFKKESRQELATTNFQKFTYLEKIGNTNERDEFLWAVKQGPCFSEAPIMFTAHDEPFEKRNGSKLVWLFISFVTGALVWFIFLLFPGFDKARYPKPLNK